LIIIAATGSAAPQCGAAYPQNATLRSLARPGRTGVRRSQRPSGLRPVRSPVRLGGDYDQGHPGRYDNLDYDNDNDNDNDTKSIR
jgi:hypothetical protein